MKIKSLLLALFASVSVFAACSSGCKTNDNIPPGSSTNTNSVQSVATTCAIVEMSSQLAVYAVLRNEPEARPYFQTAVLLINAAISKGDYSPDAISNILSKVTIDGKDREIVFMAITSTLTLYRVVWAEAAGKQLDKNIYVKPVLEALARGIQMGMSAITTEKKLNLPRK
jgi:hypothetical protein